MMFNECYSTLLFEFYDSISYSHWPESKLLIVLYIVRILYVACGMSNIGYRKWFAREHDSKELTLLKKYGKTLQPSRSVE